MKKFVALLMAICLVAGITSCTKMCKCVLLKNGNTVENATEFERELDKAYNDCSAMSDFDETSQTGIQCK
ncbi:MAG: hypothetical protein J5644_08105 [Bacteroidales bacterium]|nr:hypothetical protein [Bacteroidales bacterium]